MPDAAGNFRLLRLPWRRAAALALAFLAAVKAAPARAGAPNPEGFVYAIVGDVDTFDPHWQYFKNDPLKILQPGDHLRVDLAVSPHPDFEDEHRHFAFRNAVNHPAVAHAQLPVAEEFFSERLAIRLWISRQLFADVPQDPAAGFLIQCRQILIKNKLVELDLPRHRNRFSTSSREIRRPLPEVSRRRASKASKTSVAASRASRMAA